MSCVETAISNHFEVFFWYVSDKPFDEVHGRYSLYHIFFVFMPVVMKGNEFTIVFINSGCSDNRATEITTDIFDYVFLDRIDSVWHKHRNLVCVRNNIRL